MADFIAEWTDTQLPPPQIQVDCWTMYFDGSVMKIGAGTGLLFVSPLGVNMRYVVRLHFSASNNMAEYEALLSGLRIVIELGVKRLDIRGDSQLVIYQVMKESSCHDAKMEAYCIVVCLHLWVVIARLLHHLIDHELRVPAHVEALDAKLDGDAEATEEGLVLRHVVRCREMQAYYVALVLSEG